MAAAWDPTGATDSRRCSLISPLLLAKDVDRVPLSRPLGNGTPSEDAKIGGMNPAHQDAG
jgi:hypothetical protein